MTRVRPGKKRVSTRAPQGYAGRPAASSRDKRTITDSDRHAHETHENIIGESFPTVAGSALSGERVHLPADLAGAPAVLLVAYRRGTQADIDRWSAFLGREAPGLKALELPVIPALVWRPLATWIDGGMRGGVPRESWSRVVTLYEDGRPVRDFLGDSIGSAAIAVVLDETGVVRWIERSGFAPERARAVLGALADLAAGASTAGPTAEP